MICVTKTIENFKCCDTVYTFQTCFIPISFSFRKIRNENLFGLTGRFEIIQKG